jgi:thiol-disulfide isomerase/thioredoxin
MLLVCMMRNLKTVGIAFAGAMASTIAILFGQSQAGGAAAGSSEKIMPSPAWELQDVDGKTVQSADFKGKVVILDFWATWCGPCKAEIPSLIALQDKYGKDGLAVVGISVDTDGAAVVKKFAGRLGINYPVVLADQKITRAFGGIEVIPATFIVDREGRIVKRHLGLAMQEELENELKPLLHQ